MANDGFLKDFDARASEERTEELRLWRKYWNDFQSYMAELNFFVRGGDNESSLILEWGTDAILNVALTTTPQLSLSFIVPDNGMSLGDLAVQSHDFTGDCKFARIAPLIFKFDPCRVDNIDSNSGKAFGSLRGMCADTCRLHDPDSPDYSTIEGFINFTELYQAQSGLGITLLSNVNHESNEACAVFRTGMCFLNMTWCADFCTVCPFFCW